jgi:hypothetical protein
MPQLMFVLSAVKDSISPNHNKHRVFLVHQITAPKILLQHQRLSVQIHARVQQKDINIVTQMHTAFSFQKHPTLNANASLDLMELERNAQVIFE